MVVMELLKIVTNLIPYYESFSSNETNCTNLFCTVVYFCFKKSFKIYPVYHFVCCFEHADYIGYVTSLTRTKKSYLIM